MEYIRLGKTDMKVSRIGLGAWQFSGDAWGAIDYQTAKEVVAKAYEVGINFFDTAAVYGRVPRQSPQRTGPQRPRLHCHKDTRGVATPSGHFSCSRESEA